MDLKTACQKYLDLGFEIIFLKPNSKESNFYGTISNLYTPEANERSINYAISQNLNIGLRMDAVVDNLPNPTFLFALDFDDLEVYEEWKTANPHLATTPTQRTPGGIHVLLASPNSWLGAKSEKLDLIGYGWHIAVEPSLHPNGQPYRWLLPPWEAPLARFTNLTALGIPEPIWLSLDWEADEYPNHNPALDDRQDDWVEEWYDDDDEDNEDWDDDPDWDDDGDGPQPAIDHLEVTY